MSVSYEAIPPERRDQYLYTAQQAVAEGIASMFDADLLELEARIESKANDFIRDARTSQMLFAYSRAKVVPEAEQYLQFATYASQFPDEVEKFVQESDVVGQIQEGRGQNQALPADIEGPGSILPPRHRSRTYQRPAREVMDKGFRFPGMQDPAFLNDNPPHNE